MAVSTGKMTNVGAVSVVDAWLASSAAPSYFKVGEGGWYDDAGTRKQRTPSVSLTDLDCIQNPGSYPSDSRYYYQKSFVVGDVVKEVAAAGSVVRCKCFLDFLEGNDTLEAEFWEIGIYTAAGVLLGYATFAKVAKNAGKQFEHYFRFTLGGT